MDGGIAEDSFRLLWSGLSDWLLIPPIRMVGRREATNTVTRQRVPAHRRHRRDRGATRVIPTKPTDMVDDQY